MGDARIFWTNVFWLLEHQGRTATYMARQLGVSTATLYRWRDGSRVAPVAQRARAAEILGVPERLLFWAIDLPAGDNLAPPVEVEGVPA